MTTGRTARARPSARAPQPYDVGKQLISSGQLAIRRDVSAEVAGYPTFIVLTIRTRVDDADRVGLALAARPSTRLVVGCAGEANLVAGFWVPNLDGLQALEHELLTSHPGTEIIDRLIGTRSVKRVGQVLDPLGRLRERAEGRG